jgi:hypothetical protein
MDAIIFALTIVGGLVVVRAVSSFFDLRARMRDQMRSAPRDDWQRAERGRPANSDSVPRIDDFRVPNDDRRFSIRKSQILETCPLEILERVARACAEQARKDAENTRGTTVEKIHLETHTRYLRFAKMVKAVRLELDPEPPPSNVSDQNEVTETGPCFDPTMLPHLTVFALAGCDYSPSRPIKKTT